MKNYKGNSNDIMLKRIKTIIAYIIMMIFIAIIIAILIIGNIISQKEEKIKFQETSDIDYKVNLKENEFFEDNYLKKDNQYIASLIDNIEANFYYDIDFLNQKEKYQYTYRIDAEVKVSEKLTHKELYSSKEVIVPETSGDANDILKIDKKVNIDYNKYNDLIQKFVNTYELDNSESTVSINMYVDILDDIVEKNKERPVSMLVIPLTHKTVAVEVIENVVKPANTGEDNNSIFLYIELLLGVLEIILLVKLIIYIKGTEDEESLYKMNLKKIIYNYGSCIQKISNNFDYTGYQSIEVKNFENLIQIREMVQAPILLLEREEEAHFMLPTQNKIIYMYELNYGNKKERLK